MPYFINQVKLYDLGSVSAGFCIFTGKSAINILDPVTLNWTTLVVSENINDKKVMKAEETF